MYLEDKELLGYWIEKNPKQENTEVWQKLCDPQSAVYGLTVRVGCFHAEYGGKGQHIFD